MSELHPMPGAPGLLAVELSGVGGRLALVRDPSQPLALLQVYAEGRAVAMRLDDTALRVLSLACSEAIGTGAHDSDDWQRETLPMPL